MANTPTIDLRDYTSKAEKVIQELRRERNFRNFTTSKIRNILSMVNEIYNDVLLEQEETLSQDVQDRILHLKVRLVYECGREQIVKTFCQKAQLQEIISAIGNSRSRFITFSRYMEALVAYHRFYDGRDM
ncbi:MAG: type III-A CRISPR-associated protein Csm2 [Clostridia bacterium]|jgi:CRISPR-associated protein Csm2